MKKLFFDIQITGHHTEYISHLVNYLCKNKTITEYYFVVNPFFLEKFPHISEKANEAGNIHWISITIAEYESCISNSTIKNSFCIYKVMHKYAEELKVKHVCLLYFNIFQLALIFYRSSYTLSGILFLQFYRMDKNSLKDQLKYWRKYVITKLYTLNPKIKRVFILNDKKTITYLNNEFCTDIFKMLPDPIPALTPLKDFDIHEYYSSEKNRKVFLHIGSLGDRKGTFEIIDSVTSISKKHQSKVFILIVGKVENSLIEERLLEKIAVNKSNSEVLIVWDNQFVSNELMKSLFDKSDIVLMPYKNTEASSGILGHAAAANKSVIATGKGLIREIIEENNLGFLIDNVTPGEIALKIDEILSSDFLLTPKSSFVEKHSPVKFAELVLS